MKSAYSSSTTLHFNYPWIVNCYVDSADKHFTYPWIVNSSIYVQLDELV